MGWCLMMRGTTRTPFPEVMGVGRGEGAGWGWVRGWKGGGVGGRDCVAWPLGGGGRGLGGGGLSGCRGKSKWVGTHPSVPHLKVDKSAKRCVRIIGAGKLHRGHEELHVRLARAVAAGKPDRRDAAARVRGRNANGSRRAHAVVDPAG
jgi:hypothetical protein